MFTAIQIYAKVWPRITASTVTVHPLTITLHRLCSIVAQDLGICCWDSIFAKNLLGGTFDEVLGIEPKNEGQRKEAENELRHRPRNCDCDRLFGCNHFYTRGLFGWSPVSHRENTVRSVVRRGKGLKDWCFGPFKGVYKGGNVSPHVVVVPWRTKRDRWKDHMSELLDYHDIHGHCNVPKRYSENTKLANWVSYQRQQYKLHEKGKPSQITTLRIQKLESSGFAWNTFEAVWKERLNELSDYNYIHQHCNVPSPRRRSQRTKLGTWVKTQRREYRLYVGGKPSHMTPSRIQALEALGFEWGVYHPPWEDLLSELAAFRETHEHCNVPQGYSVTKSNGENAKLGPWVHTQRTQYRFHLEGKASAMTDLRIKELENLGFEWNPRKLKARVPIAM
jgi:hypothetical protein